jgi:hypothetical protein
MLISRHGSESTALESAAVAMVSLLDSRAGDNGNFVLTIARRAASTGPSDLGCQWLVAAAQYRAGDRQGALETLEQAQPPDESALSFVTPQGCTARANWLLGQTIRALIDRELGNGEAFAKRLDTLRKAIVGLKSTALQYCDDGENWRIAFAVLFAERELGDLRAPTAR